MKNKTLTFFFICLLSLVLGVTGVWGQNRSKDEVVQSMQARHSSLMQAKNQGLVGEAWNGMVGIVDPGAASGVQDLVDSENRDRRDLYQIIASETGTSVQEVALQNRIRMYRLADDNHFVQDQHRNWVRKKDLN
ncbi:YdbL family protein [Desulfonatronospira sp.]|uniref:YdbL family protein n=1 Tax=Desulfonatronospira sp. TaxID=1962951 RepID=UPI0025BC36C6|nr:YdbL family protein [Desulfonatronospira sp.]